MGNLLSWRYTFTRTKTEVVGWEDIRAEISQSRRIVAFTGSGVSKASGIPTFRDTGDAIWAKYDMYKCGTKWGFNKHPECLWTLVSEFAESVNPQPNDAHIALAKLSQMGKLLGVITQNIDGLHQLAGCTNVIELHGNLQSVSLSVTIGVIGYRRRVLNVDTV
eukprot:GHVO01036942.1.p1 GENE.GHVO01036942.1~~GHVO01036942.1.p1  ORF type:complete len:173 (+),score=19.70 GHVO01036942.1:31-519(+)